MTNIGTIVENTFIVICNISGKFFLAEVNLIKQNLSFELIETEIFEKGKISKFVNEKFAVVDEWVSEPAFQQGIALTTFSCALSCAVLIFGVSKAHAIDEVAEKMQKRTWLQYGAQLKDSIRTKNIYQAIKQNLPTSKTVTLFVIGSLTGVILTLSVERLYGLNLGVQQNAFYENKIQKINLAVRLIQTKFDLCIEKSNQNFKNHEKCYEVMRKLYLILKELYPFLAEHSDVKLDPLPSRKQIKSLAPKSFVI